jgi:palmitoyltransferase
MSHKANSRPVGYIYRQRHQHGLAAALITLYFVFFLLTLAAYVRTFYTAQTNPSLVPWSDRREAVDKDRKTRPKRERDDLEAQHPWAPVDMDPDSPGLEAFYSKEIFLCEPDGRPRWCSLCWTWKPDRASHSSELGRCVRKMDHLCPWVGGMVSETSFNFFVQFTFYCTLYLGVCLAVAGYSLRKQLDEGRALDGRIVAVLALAGLFCFFTVGMTLTSGKYIFENITNIDVLRKSSVYHIAIRVPPHTEPSSEYTTVIYPLPLQAPQQGHQYMANNYADAARDRHATHTFAIVRTEPGENPFDLGPWRNFKAVMGNTVLEWLFPIKHSPCCDHDSMISDYEFGPLIEELKKRHNIPGANKPGNPALSSNDTLS